MANNEHQIWKFPVTATDEFKVRMPADAHILTVDVQHGKPFMWASVNPDAEYVARNFRLVGTGHPVDPDELRRYIGTFQLEGGALVFHLFEAPQQQESPDETRPV